MFGQLNDDKQVATRHTKFDSSKRNFGFDEMKILSKTQHFQIFVDEKIKIVTKLIKNELNLINFEQICTSTFLKILKFAIMHIFKIYQNRSKTIKTN